MCFFVTVIKKTKSDIKFKLMKKNKLLTIIITVIIISSYFILNFNIGDGKFKSLKFPNNDQRYLIKKYLFPYKFIAQQSKEISSLQYRLSLQEEIISDQKVSNLKAEIFEAQIDGDITIEETVITLSNNLTLKKYLLKTGFYAGINQYSPGSGHISFYEDNLVIISSRGMLAYKKVNTDDKVNFKKIKNNINDYIGLSQFEKGRNFSLKDLFIFKNKIFISYTEEIKDDCWNIGVIFGDMNYENIKFTKFFSPKNCVHSTDNIDKEFSGGQSGGRIVSFDDNHILLSIGDFVSRHLAQNKNSVNGKIIKINIDNSDYELISMGHRNPQGLLFDKENNILLETEHGPRGGDEINLIDLNEMSQNKIPNYGWAISSYGEHYGGKSETNKKKYEKYPLYKSHNEHGFIEPLKVYEPSVGISNIVKIGKNKYVHGSMGGPFGRGREYNPEKRAGDKSLFFFELNEKRQIINYKQVKVFERIRDLGFKDNQLYLFMENTASIGVIDLN